MKTTVEHQRTEVRNNWHQTATITVVIHGGDDIHVTDALKALELAYQDTRAKLQRYMRGADHR